MSKYSYLIRPLSPLVFGNGKPFDAQSEASDIVFPLPSSAAGLLRTQYLKQNKLLLNQADKHLKLSDEDHCKLLETRQFGPFLVELLDNNQYNLFVTKPADALYLLDKKDQKLKLVRLEPKELSQDMGCDLPKGLLPVMMNAEIKGKPQPGALFWRIEDSIAWQNGSDLTYEDVNERGIKNLPVDIRTHVAIDDATLSSEEGRLFQSIAYDLGATRKENYSGWEDRSYGFLILSDQSLQNGLVKFGGEGRLSEMSQVEQPTCLTLDDKIIKNIQQSHRLKLTLLTPAIFEQGYLPAWINKETLKGVLPHTNIQVQLKACSMDRWLPISGWDMQSHRPKAMRKAVASGAIYWFEIISGEIGGIKDLMMQSVCDHPQDQKDGFGIVSVASWVQN